MDTSSSFPSYDYPWQATFAKISLRLRHELRSATNVSVTSEKQTPKKLTAEATFMICIIFIFLIFAAIGTTITVYDSHYKPHKKRRSSDGDIDVKKHNSSRREKTSTKNSAVWVEKFKTFFNCFCIYTNGRRLLRTVSNEEDFVWLCGIRVVGTIVTISMHVFVSYILSVGSLKGLKPWMDCWFVPFFLNGLFMMSFYFVLSGFLVGYFASCYYFQNGGIPWFGFYWKRFEKIVPLYAIVLGYYAILFSYTGSGPSWPTYDTNPVCKESWLQNLFFINNFQTLFEQCFAPGWYVAIDMQFHLITPLFLVSLFKWPRFGYGLIILSICASCCYRCILTIKYSLFHPMSSLRNYIDDDFDSFIRGNLIYFDQLHMKPFQNLCTYLIGLGWGHYIMKREICKKRNDSKLILCCGWIGWLISNWICFHVLYHSEESLLKHIAYSGFGGILFACGTGWVLHICTTKQAGFLCRFLSLKIFLPLSRLSFAAYLIHVIVLLHYLLSATEQEETFNLISMFSLIFHVVFWTYIISFTVSLFVEFPISRVFRWIHNK